MWNEGLESYSTDCVWMNVLETVPLCTFSFRSYGETLKLMKIHDKLSK